MKTVYLPIEVATRESESRVREAAHLLEMGARVVIGQQWSMFKNIEMGTPKGVVMFKTMNNIQGGMMRPVKEAGCVIAGIDEEVLGADCADGYLIATGKKAVELCDVFFAENEEHANHLAKLCPSLKTVVTGNGRTDTTPERMGRIKEQADIIRKEYGDFILFNSNYGTLNTKLGNPDAIRNIAARAGTLVGGDFDAVMQWERANFGTVVPVLDVVRRDYSLIIRPHPSECPVWWQKRYDGCVVTGTPPLPWIMASRLVLHTGCTTGYEAQLLGRPVLNIEPMSHPIYLSRKLDANPSVQFLPDAVREIKAFMGGHDSMIFDETDTTNDTDHCENVANELFKLAPDTDGGFGKYTRIPRNPFEVAKCRISLEMMSRDIADFSSSRVNITELDDSVFLLERRDK